MSWFHDKLAPRGRRYGFNPVWVGVIALVVIAIGVYFGFAKAFPFTHGFQLKAVFTNALNIRKGSFVRIAGVNVGKVTGVSRYDSSDAAVVKMDIDGKGLPLHRDV